MSDLDLDLTPMLKKKMASYPRKRGRYNSSELYGITHGYVTPQTWMVPRQRSPEELLRMWGGILVHDHVQRFLPPDTNEVKREHFYRGITLVGKADNVPKNSDEVWEFKSSAKAMAKSSPSHDYQVKLYCSMFERETGLIFQPVQNKKGLFLKRIGTITRDDVWFEEQLDKLYEFHLEVEKLWEANELPM